MPSDDALQPDHDPVAVFESGLTLYGDQFDETILNQDDPFEAGLLGILTEQSSLIAETQRIEREELKLEINPTLDDDVYASQFKVARVAACFHRDHSDFEATQLQGILQGGLDNHRKFNESRLRLKEPLNEIMSMEPSERQFFAMAVEGRYSSTEIDFLITDLAAQVIDAIEQGDSKRERSLWIDVFMFEKEIDPAALANQIMTVGRSLRDGLDSESGDDL